MPITFGGDAGAATEDVGEGPGVDELTVAGVGDAVCAMTRRDMPSVTQRTTTKIVRVAVVFMCRSEPSQGSEIVFAAIKSIEIHVVAGNTVDCSHLAELPDCVIAETLRNVRL